jgi:RNA-binding protein YlmH
MHLSKEEQILLQHYNDLIQLSYQRGIPVYSGFSGLNEMALAYQALDAFYGKNNWQEGRQALAFGGYQDAERRIICFLPDSELTGAEELDFPISCVRIAPANKRFCDRLNHRDYLGTVMNLGLTRDQIGDILVKNEDKDAYQAVTGYIFCKHDKAELITALNRIKHTTVISEVISNQEFDWKPEFKELSGSVSSFRLDAVLSVAIQTSRSQGLALIQEGNVFLNGRCCTENAKKLEENDVFSIRGYGKFIFDKASTAPSKKGRYHITVKQYI